MDQSAYKSQKLQALWATKELKSLKIRKPFAGTRGLQVAKVVSPLGDQGAYKYHSLGGTRGLTSHKPFGGPKRLHNSQALWWTKRLTSRKSCKPFRGPKSQGCTIGVPPRILKTPRVHHWGHTANSLHPKGAPLVSHSEFTKPLECTIGVPPRIHKTPSLHHWGPTANAQNPKGAPLVSHHEFTKPQVCTIGVPQ